MSHRPWPDAWQEALYGNDGFYRRPEGPAGHFATSAQGIPGVAAVLAQALVATAASVDAEVLVDFACGRGELLTTISPFAGTELALVGVDVADRPAGLDPNIAWVRSPGGSWVPPLDVISGRTTLVVAHEWLDVVPCEISEVDDDGILREVLVAPDGTESLGAVRADAGRPQPSATDTAPPLRHPGERVEHPQTRDDAWHSLVRRTREHAAPGSVVLGIDYAFRAQEMPPFGTLTGFRDGVECPPTPDGTCDITSHVVLDGLDLTHPPRTQRDVLLDLFGDDPLAPVSIELATSDPAHYLERLAVRSAFSAVTARRGLGDFVWFTHQV